MGDSNDPRDRPAPDWQAAAFEKLEALSGAIYREAPNPQHVQTRRLGAALRLVIDRMVSTEAPADELAAAADQVEALAERLGSFRHGGRYRDFAEHPGGSYLPEYLEFTPVLGRSNPLAPPLSIEVIGCQVIGRARFGAAYEGPPGCVHGGFIAACFDDVLGVVQSAAGAMAMTGALSVRYLAPTPLHAEVRFVGTLGAVAGRKVATHGQLWVGGDDGAGAACTAEADGLFITVDADRFEQLRAASPRVDAES